MKTVTWNIQKIIIYDFMIVVKGASSTGNVWGELDGQYKKKVAKKNWKND